MDGLREGELKTKNVRQIKVSPVGLLLLGPGSSSSHVFRLASSQIRNQQRSVVLQNRFLQPSLGLLVDELLVEGNQGSAEGESYGVNLAHSSSSSHSDSNVEFGELILAEDQEGLDYFHSERGRFEDIQRPSVNSESSLSRLAESCGNRLFFLPEGLYILVGVCHYYSTLYFLSAINKFPH